jgi:glucosamine--fructose-6-phosphate aminotransferase (isomerizing)
MCGIVGYVGPQSAVPVVIGGLRKLEYRGYDSAGIALLDKDHFHVERAVGKLANLERKLYGFGDDVDQTHLNVAMGHTRWATHGSVTERNAHPHLSMSGRVAIVQNGIVENFLELKHELQAEGVEFRSETDTEVIVQLVDKFLATGFDFEKAAHMALGQLRGSSAVVLLHVAEPGTMIAARLGNAGGVVVGLGDGEVLVASDVPGVLDCTRRVLFLDDGEVVVAKVGDVKVRKLNGGVVHKEVHTIAWDPVAAEKGEYRHFMQKEIFEQGRAITDTIRGRVDFEHGHVTLEGMKSGWLPNKVFSAAMGTSSFSTLVGKFIIENIARVPVEVDNASEFRYRNPLITPYDAVLGITQSGETADTLAAMQEGRDKKAKVWSIVNAIGSQAQRVSDGTITMRAGPEIGVASTKAFTTSVVDQYLLALWMAQEAVGNGRGELSPKHYQQVLDLSHLPGLVSKMLEKNIVYDDIANIYHTREHFLYLGRGINFPVALEGALKMKEISYIHAEGYPAGEMKHGPIALIDENMPVVCICLRDAVYEKMVSQIEQVRARHGTVIAIATEGDEDIARKADFVIYVPQAPDLLTPVLTAIPMQRLAYHMAIRRGCDVDQPRNLAKSVTVE